MDIVDTKYLVLGREEPYFVTELSDSNTSSKYTEEDIINMLEFLVQNISVKWERFLQHTVGIPMGTNCAPLLAEIHLYFWTRTKRNSYNLLSRLERNSI